MAWTDERMDDFAKHTDQRFDAVDKRFDVVDRRFDAVDKRFDAVDRRFGELNRSIEGLHETIHRTMLQLGGGLIVAVAIGFAGIVVTQL